MVRYLRELRGWSQEHLALASGLSVRTVQRVEATGRGLPETWMALAATLEVAQEDLRLNGPHLTIDHQTDPWPGLHIRVFKDGYQAGGCLSLDSRRRTVRQIGFPALVLDIPDEEYMDRVKFCWDHPEATESFTPIGQHFPVERLRYLVDGKVFNPYEHIRESLYDAVMVVGPAEMIKRYRDQFPKHFIPSPTPSVVPVLPVPRVSKGLEKYRA